MIYGNFEEMLPYRLLTVAVLLIFTLFILRKCLFRKSTAYEPIR